MFSFDVNTGPTGTQPVAARSGLFHLPHGDVRTPIFMPVATQAALKGITVEQLEELDVEIILGNTYHLALRPGEEVLRQLTRRKNVDSVHQTVDSMEDVKEICNTNGSSDSNNNSNNNNNKSEKLTNDNEPIDSKVDLVINNMDGIHFLQSWRRNILTDSGGFQMVSLLKLANITEDGVRFQSTHGGAKAKDDDVASPALPLPSEHTEEIAKKQLKITNHLVMKRERETDEDNTRITEKDNGETNESDCNSSNGANDKCTDSSYSLLLRPEDSIRIQNAIGGDVMMQLDDVVHVLTTGERVREAAERSIR